MKVGKKFLSFVFVLVMVVTVTFSVSEAKASTNYTNKVNVFDVYQSGTYAQITRGNSGVVMRSNSWTGKTGYITVSSSNFGPDGMGLTTSFYYKISSMVDGGTITFYIGSTKVGQGKIHTYNKNKSYGSIIKIDCMGTGYYYKWHT